ncbi:30S ribosomal protein S18 [Patescibacteria group bacterium]
MKRKFIRKKYQKNVNAKCFFCENKSEPEYKETNILEKYMTERGKIIARSRTGLCNNHQKKLTKAIKQARHVALLPFVIGV